MFITTPTLDLHHHRFISTAELCFENRATATLFSSFIAYLFMFLFCLNISCVFISFLALVFCLFSSILFSIKHSFNFFFHWVTTVLLIQCVCVLNVLLFFCLHFHHLKISYNCLPPSSRARTHTQQLAILKHIRIHWVLWVCVCVAWFTCMLRVYFS